ncbi:hypothetical protein TPB0596_36600 [Tsukamurella pulmonis]|uniref:Uncharacterized protein n=1 Tax=Tsukamurella pulmonis TaxID=47312 RepID=A0A1H1CKG7_9ACTN|nr:hypothetical protein [Tsukamurella pulmonis]BDD83897.1 hypothetical protein TPB0596_36600 [Tsukamurella pulmonis]SDQ64725.1 hypothetical protein SAMN04489765_1254 [Tsukamurella pulmonis]SUP23586.1 Uncharacterised protein [Tsukamurella pulmonis]
MSEKDETDLSGLAETPAEAAAEARQAQLDAREAVGADFDDDGDDEIAEEEGIS